MLSLPAASFRPEAMQPPGLKRAVQCVTKETIVSAAVFVGAALAADQQGRKSNRMANLYDSDEDDSADDADGDLPAAGAAGAADAQLGLSVDGANTHAAACNSTADAEATIGTGAAVPSDVLAAPRTDTAMLSSQQQTAPSTVLQADTPGKGEDRPAELRSIIVDALLTNVELQAVLQQDLQAIVNKHAEIDAQQKRQPSVLIANLLASAVAKDRV
ncbi:MAG: hypothetical protein FRX49_12923 [Trebouxia sp. A1-2]|nr:MAG: hypothetical protein FRX49_12923 [Trebouxia sp. A1-2]